MKAIYPVTITTKLDECKQFYMNHFGFTAVFEADWYVQLLHEASKVEIGLMLPGLKNQPTQFHDEFSAKGIIYTLEVDNVDAEYERLKDAGVDIFCSPATEEWGQRHFCLQDPSGVVIDVVEQVN